MTEKESLEKFRELFDDISGGNIDESESDNAITVSKDVYESLSAEDNLYKLKENLEIAKDELSGGVELKRQKIEENIIEAVKEVDEKKDEKNFEEPLKIDEESSDTKDSIKDSNSFETDQRSGDQVMESLSDSQFTWIFNSPNTKFDNFYEEKKKLVKNITQGDILPFKKWRTELKEAKIDLSDIQYDDKTLSEKMTAVQKWRDRIQEIILRTDHQYFLWHRFEKLLRGFLASIAYEAPQEKFNGVVYRHMRDVEAYYGQLEALKDSIEAVMKNLDSVFNLLSRQLTLIMKPNFVPTIYESDHKNRFNEDEDDKVDRDIIKKEFDGLKSEYKKPVQKPKAFDSGWDL